MTINQDLLSINLRTEKNLRYILAIYYQAWVTVYEKKLIYFDIYCKKKYLRDSDVIIRYDCNGELETLIA